MCSLEGSRARYRARSPDLRPHTVSMFLITVWLLEINLLVWKGTGSPQKLHLFRIKKLPTFAMKNESEV